MNIMELLILAAQNAASDLHLSAEKPPFIRINGCLQPLHNFAISHETLKEFIATILPCSKQKLMSEIYECDFAFSMTKEVRFRVNVYQEQHGIAAAFRVIPTNIPTLDEISSLPIFKTLATKSNGLILLTGPTGCGKSTTLAAMIDYVNQHFAQHILTLEDPIEFIHQSKKSLIHQREIHRDTKSFSDALSGALRADPDVILIGEMRDLVSIRLALTAAETGHLVFATLHTASAAQTINRIIDVFPAEEKSVVRTLLSHTLEAVISQHLIQKNGGGRVAVHEIMICTPAVSNLIREDKVAQLSSVIEMGAQFGMQTKEQHLRKLVEEGMIERNRISSLPTGEVGP